MYDTFLCSIFFSLLLTYRSKLRDRLTVAGCVLVCRMRQLCHVTLTFLQSVLDVSNGCLKVILKPFIHTPFFLLFLNDSRVTCV